MKKRNKKHRVKPVRLPVFLYKLLPEITEGERASVDLYPLIHLQQLRDGVGTEESAWEVQVSLRHAWIMSQGFEEKDTMRMLFLLAFASLNAMAQLIRCEEELPPALFEPVELAMEYFKEMKDSLSRTELICSMRATADSGRIFNIAKGAGWLVYPEDDDWKKLLGRRGCVVLNKKVRSGYLNVNEEMGGRLEWISPTEDWLTIPITKPFVLLLTEPLAEEEEANQ